MNKTRAKALLQSAIDEIVGLRNRVGWSDEFQKWRRSTERVLEYVFAPGSQHIAEFKAVSYSHWQHPQDFLENYYAQGLNTAAGLLQCMIAEIESYWPEEENLVLTHDVWMFIHPSIRGVSERAFESELYADSVETAFKYINSIVKTRIKRKTGKELDGAALMNIAFSINNPLITFDDVSSETGRNIQQGYMQIFAGAMTGIRNPKAHDVIKITRERAVHFLFLASLLMYKLDEAD